MNYEEMTIPEIKAILDENNIEYSLGKVKSYYVDLAKTIPIVEETESAKPSSVIDAVKSAITIERTETKKVDNVSYLAGRDYNQLSVGERMIIREQSPEYSDVSSGVKVTVTDRLPTKWRIVKLADKSYSKLIKGETYMLAQADYDAIKNVQVEVKTEETKDKCCGQAVYESVSLLEVVND